VTGYFTQKNASGNYETHLTTAKFLWANVATDWVTSYNTFAGKPAAIALDEQNNVYVTGRVWNTNNHYRVISVKGGSSMKKMLGISLLVIMTFCWATLAGAATTPPNLVGKWEGTARGVVGSTFIPSAATGSGSNWVLSITKQVDNRIYGTSNVSPPLGDGTESNISGVVMGDEIHVVSLIYPVTCFLKILFNPPGKPGLEGYFLGYGGGGSPKMSVFFRLQKTSETP
jgi:hypothetical protein